MPVKGMPLAESTLDRVYAMNGKSIEVDNTDAEGRLVLAGANYGLRTAKWEAVADVPI